jgi:predicted RNase H-like HicB family nuclease
MIKYEVIIYWSDEDEAFIAEVPELPGCMAHGDTQDAALGNALDAIRLWDPDGQGVRGSDSGAEGPPLDLRLMAQSQAVSVEGSATTKHARMPSARRRESPASAA